MCIRDSLETLIVIIESETKLLLLEMNIHKKVREAIDENQRDYYLREQLKVCLLYTSSFMARPNSTNISPWVMQMLVSPRVTTQTSQGSSASVILP